MNISSKITIMLTITLLIYSLSFFSNTSYASDSLKVDVNLDTLSQKNLNTSRELRIILTPIEIQKLDSSLTDQHQLLIDTLKTIFSSPSFSNIQLEIVKDDSADRINEIPDKKDSTFTIARENYDADVLLSGILSYDEKQNIIYQPHFTILNNAKLDSHQSADIKSLSGKTCQLKQFFLPAVTFDNLNPFINFLSGYFLILNNKYSEANHKLKDSDSLPEYFYLAESYLNRGMSHQQALDLARADWDSSIFFFKRCFLYTKSSTDSIFINNNLGVVLQLMGKLDSATVYYTIAYNNLSSELAHDDFIRISNNLGNVYLLDGQWKKALDIFQSNVEVMEQSHDSLNLATTYENLGNIYQLIKQRHKAITFYTKALEIRESFNDENGIANLFNFLGNIHQETEEYNKAKDYFGQALKINQKLHNEPQIADSYDRLGQVFQDLDIMDSALVFYQKSYDTFELLDDKEGLVRTIFHQATVYQKQKNFPQAIALYEKALQFTNGDDSKSLQAQIYDRMGDIYNNQDNLVPAMDYYQQSADLYEQLGNFETLSLILYNMGLIKLKQNDYARGYELLKKAITIDEEHGFNNLRGEKDFLDQLEGILKKN